MANLKLLEYRYPENYQNKFEDMCYQLFCTHLNASCRVPYRTPNLQAVECEPVVIGNKRYSFQAKYYESEIRLRERKNDLIKCIMDARLMGITNLLIFVNKDKGVVTNGSQPNEKPQYLVDIEKEALGDQTNPGMVVDWWFKQRIEDALDMNQHRSIRDRFFGESHILDYYDYVCKRFDDDEGSELYGKIPLRKCYIEPMISNGNQCSYVREYVESWVNNEDTARSIAVICGEPGHGKTSFCQKAVRDFYKNRWLTDGVCNVLYFSLNPTDTEALDNNDSFRFYSLLSWGQDRRNNGQKIGVKDCKDSLIFLDGFDELLERTQQFNLKDFIERNIIEFQKDTGAHIIITSRSMVVEPGNTNLKVYDGKNGITIDVPILRMQPISKKTQLQWIKDYIYYLYSLLASDSSAMLLAKREVLKREKDKLEAYLGSYQRLHENQTLQAILGVPIIFRMVVAARYMPDGTESIVQMYDKLFELTWRRHEHSGRGPSIQAAKEHLSHHALMVYFSDTDMAVVKGKLEAHWWLFQFYTERGAQNKQEKSNRVGFLHSSFYQYFLAHEVVSWFRKYTNAENCRSGKKVFRNNLSSLACRKLDKTTLGYIRDVQNKEDVFDDAFCKAYEILKETDGFLTISKNQDDRNWIRKLGRLEGATNLFWNIVSICCICGHGVTTNNINTFALRTYDLSKCILSYSNFKETDLHGATLGDADLRGADLRGADLRGADLRGADLRGADLRGADLEDANLLRAHLEKTQLEKAHLEKAHLEEAYLHGTHLEQAHLAGADLDYADLREAHLENADFRWADLRWADLTGAHLRDTDLRWADTREFKCNEKDLGKAKRTET